MECPKCKFEIEKGSKFCTECGTPLFKKCEKCDANNNIYSKFCANCGHPYPVLDLRVEYYKSKMNFYDNIEICPSKEGTYILVEDKKKYKILDIHSLCSVTNYEFEEFGVRIGYGNISFVLGDFSFITAKKDGLWGIINPLNGKIICDFKYIDSKIVHYVGDYAANGTVLLKEKDKWGKVEGSTGSVILPFIYDEIYDEDLDGFDFDLLKYNGYWGVIRSGEQILPFEYAKVNYRTHDWHEHLFDFYLYKPIPPSQHKNGKWGVVDIYNGKIILSCKYDEIIFWGYDVQNDETYKIRKGDKWGVCFDGKIVVPCEYDDIEVLVYHECFIGHLWLYKVRKDNKWGILNACSGHVELLCEYDDIYYFDGYLDGVKTTNIIFNKGKKYGKIVFEGLSFARRYDCIYSEDEIRKLSNYECE